MKKQIKKLQLNKMSISNLTSSEMNRQVGGTVLSETP
ncbi:MAG: rSAM-modified peptide [Chitinophagales bacterium]|nr:rSAM-modified peptide [Chitinophagales bacterium]